jgi:nitrate/TMAO reductase-like tetraheme cytochrome c subunit
MTDNTNTETAEKETQVVKKSKKQIWTIVGIVVLFLVIAGAGTGGYLIHLSNTSPEFCATCHIMQKNVTSYLTSNDLDHVHSQANVKCKDCHDYPVQAEVASGINFVTGNYTVGDDGELKQVSYSNDMCLKCHISYEHVAASTDFLYRNPHKNHNGQLECKTCHVSHGDQVNYCSTCHDNGKQRMVGDEIKSRGTIK